MKAMSNSRGARVRWQRRAVALVVSIPAMCLPLVTMPPAQAADPVYTVTDVTRAWFYTHVTDLTSCRSRDDNPLLLNVGSSVVNPVWEHQVHVTGLRVQVLSGSKPLGTIPVRNGYLDPNEGASANYLEVSCRAWRDLLAKGFGGPSTGYQIKVIGPGEAFDTNDGSPAGAVEAPDTLFPVTVRQLAKTANLKGRKVGSEVKITTSLKAWAKRNGEFGWRPSKGTRVDLFKLNQQGTRFRQIDTAKSSKTGAVTLRLPTRRESYIQIRVPGFTSGDQATFLVTKSGELQPAGR